MFKVAGCKSRKFSFIGKLIMIVESFFSKEKIDYHHWAFFDEASGYWFNADGKIEKLTKKQFNRRYEIVLGYSIHKPVSKETRGWLLDQVGKKYSYFAILMILRYFFTGRYRSYISGDKTHICTELTLKAVKKCGFEINEDLETASIYKTQTIFERIFDNGLFTKHTV